MFATERVDGNVTIARVIMSVAQLVLNDLISTLIQMVMCHVLRFQRNPDQSEREKVNLWLKITNMIGHHDN